MRFVLVAAAVGVALLIAWLAGRNKPSAPTRTGGAVPGQLDRRDFSRPDAPWLMAVFTSATCDACQDVSTKVAVLESADVATHDAEYARDRALHDRYGIDAVPIVVIADAEGVVVRSFVGPTTATDLWAAMAELRDPGVVPPGCADH